MKITKHSILLFLSLLFVTIACKKDDPIPVGDREYPNVDKSLWLIFEHFENEGALRGLDIDLAAAGITGKIKDLGNPNVAGQCTYGGTIGHHIVIDKDFWNSTAFDLYKELVVFHELGHCYLLLEHKEAFLPNGTCKSIMRSGTGDCIDNYTAETRGYYLDELFGK